MNQLAICIIQYTVTTLAVELATSLEAHTVAHIHNLKRLVPIIKLLYGF